uniref:p840 reaction CENTER=65 kDa photosystem I large subunit homolog (Fragments) n=1 Tax=Chlorobium limicola TaxID=1092 RepID=Q9R662_CHLLI
FLFQRTRSTKWYQIFDTEKIDDEQVVSLGIDTYSTKFGDMVFSGTSAKVSFNFVEQGGKEFAEFPAYAILPRKFLN